MELPRSIVTRFDSLESRWQEEKEYECISVYGNVFKGLLMKEGGRFISLHEEDFALRFYFGDLEYELQVIDGKVTCTAWERE